MLFVAFAPSLSFLLFHFICLLRCWKKKQKHCKCNLSISMKALNFEWMGTTFCSLPRLPIIPILFKVCLFCHPLCRGAVCTETKQQQPLLSLSVSFILLLPYSSHNTSSEFVVFKSALFMHCSCWCVYREGFIPTVKQIAGVHGRIDRENDFHCLCTCFY